MPATGGTFLMRQRLLVVAVAIVLAAPLLAQKPANPDISGKWVLNLAKSKLEKGRNMQSETLFISSTGSKIEMTFTIKGTETKFEYVADGKERVVLEKGYLVQFRKAYWKKSALVTETIGRMNEPGKAIDGTEIFRTKDRWTLSTDGRVLTDVSEGLEGTVSVYDRE
jgi:hypothetical protein